MDIVEFLIYYICFHFSETDPEPTVKPESSQSSDSGSQVSLL